MAKIFMVHAEKRQVCYVTRARVNPNSKLFFTIWPRPYQILGRLAGLGFRYNQSEALS